MMSLAEKHCADADFSITQWIALRLLQDGAVKTAGELGRELQMTSGAVTRLVDTLEAKQFVRRDRSVRDRRVVHLAITPAGSAKILDMAPALAGAFNTVFDGFGDAEFAGLIAGLVKLLAALEAPVRT
jgi:DNA-binding MarR family transcriptional regulator